MANKILNSFDVWIKAQGWKSKLRLKGIDNISLEGISRLRELILGLAIQGKLVPQDLSDEPANVLLRNIIHEREQTESKNRVKKQIDVTKIEKAEIRFPLPNGWEWVRLHQIISISSGDGLTASRMTESGKIPVFGGNGINGYHGSANVRKPTLVIGRVGFYCGSVHITPSAAWVTDNAFITTFSEHNIYINFLYWLLKGTNLKENDSATAQPVISGRKVYPIVVGLPPLKEQHRIVAKVDELMALCDELEQQETDHLKSHQLLVETLLGTLLQAKDASEFQTAWAKLAEHFDDLFITDDSIDQLKQTISQLAVMSKLVPQDPNDELASELLKRIENEKDKFVEEGKIKKQASVPNIGNDEIPFRLPSTWAWSRLADVCTQITDGEHLTPPRVETGKRLLSAKNVRDGYIDYDNCDLVSEQDYLKSIKRCKAEVGDLLIVSVGGTIGRVSLVNENIPFALVRSVALIKPIIIVSEYLRLVMNSPLLQNLINEKKRGGAQPCLYLKEINEFVFPLPPIAEQKRIAIKLNELFALCERLKERIAESKKVANEMAEAVLEQVQ